MKLAQARSLMTRKALLAAAQTLFAEQGYEAVSMEELALRARVSKASIFAHFSSKQAILATLGIDDLETLLEATREQTKSGLPLEATALATCYQPWLTYFLSNPDFARLYLVQSGLIVSEESRAYVALCSNHEMLVAHALIEYDAELAPNAAMIVRGAQAHFEQVLVYRLSGWITSDSAAANDLTQALLVWVAGVKALYNDRPRK